MCGKAARRAFRRNRNRRRSRRARRRRAALRAEAAVCGGLPGEDADSLQDRKGWVRLAGVCKDRGLVFCRSISRAVIINQYKG